MQIIDPKHAFYRPLGVRIAIVAVCAFWAAVEAVWGEVIWAAGLGLLALYVLWILILRFTPAAEDEPVRPAAEED